VPDSALRRFVTDVRLTDAAFASRHQVLRVVLGLTLPLVLSVALLTGNAMGGNHSHGAPGNAQLFVLWGTIGGTLLCALLASVVTHRITGALTVSIGLVLASSALVHAGGGVTDLHFGYFVVLGLISFYQEWTAFAVAIVLVAAHHLVLGLWLPQVLFSHTHSQGNPIGYAILHTIFVLAMCAVQMGYWHYARKAINHVEALADSLREEQELLASVLSTIPHVVFWKDAEGRYLGCNDAYLDLRHLTSVAELVGRREGDLLDRSALTPTIRVLEEQVTASGRAVTDHAVRVADADGAQRALLFSVLPRYGDSGAPHGVIGVGADVTQAHELERQLAQASRLEAIGQLAAGLAHEINTPVQYVSDNLLFLTDSVNDMLRSMESLATVVRAADRTPSGVGPDATTRALLELIDGLDLEFLAQEVPGALEQTLEGVGRVAEIIRAMKEFSHPGQGRADTDLNRAIESTVQVSRSEWKYVADLDLDLDPAVGLVPCHEGEFKQVVLNLIVNAAHAVADRHQQDGRPGRIGVSTRREEDDVMIKVQDDGCGMDETTRLRVFDPFFTTKEVGKGTGQGLSMAHNCIVGKHSGSIDVVSTPGHGSTFTIRLPLVPDAVVPAPAGAGDWD
jgi:two-component system NtrC family sensor kinase